MSTASTPTERTSGSRWHSRPGRPRHHKLLYAIGIVLILLLLLQLVGSPIARAMVNRRLAEMPGYVGKAGAVKVALWRGAMEVDDFVMKEKGYESEPPLIRIDKASMKFAPGALFTGKLGGRVVIDGLEMNVTKRERLDEKDAEEAKNKMKETKEKVQHWQQVLRETFPMELTHFEVKNGKVRYKDVTYQPNAEFAVEQLHIVGRDLQNRPKANGDPLPAKLDVTAVTTGNGKLRINLQLDPIAKQPLFALNFELLGQQLPPVNSFLTAYADADVSKGTFEVYSEVNAKGGAYDGYVKPMFHDLDFRTASDEDKSLGKKLKEKVVGAVTSMLKNDENQQVATKAPFAGNFADNDVDVWTTIANLLRNAFVQALRGGLEGQNPRV